MVVQSVTIEVSTLEFPVSLKDFKLKNPKKERKKRKTFKAALGKTFGKSSKKSFPKRIDSSETFANDKLDVKALGIASNLIMWKLIDLRRMSQTSGATL